MSYIKDVPQLHEVSLGLSQRNGLLTYQTFGLRCDVHPPSGAPVTREGTRNFYQFPTMFPELTPVLPGRFEVAWSTKTRKGKWLPLLTDHFVINQRGDLSDAPVSADAMH